LKIKYNDKQLEQETNRLLFEYLTELNENIYGSPEVRPKNIKFQPKIDKDNVITFMRII
jgi:hypothetical protein